MKSTIREKWFLLIPAITCILLLVLFCQNTYAGNYNPDWVPCDDICIEDLDYLYSILYDGQFSEALYRCFCDCPGPYEFCVVQESEVLCWNAYWINDPECDLEATYYNMGDWMGSECDLSGM